MPVWKKVAKRLSIAVAGLVLLAVAALASAYVALQSDFGRNWAARELERLLSTPGETEIRIVGLEGRLPLAPRVGTVEVGDGQGTWLTVEGLGFEVDPFALTQRTLDLRFLEAERIRLDRLPDSSEEAAPDSGVPFPTRLPIGLRLRRLTVGEVSIAAAVLGAPAAFRIDGDAVSEAGTSIAVSLEVARSDGADGKIAARGRYVLSERTLDLDLTVKEPAGGMIVRALGLADLPALDARLSGAGTLADWNGDLIVALEGLSELAADIHLAAGEETGFSLAGSLEGPAPFTDLPWRLLSGRTAFELAGRWSPPATLAIERARVASPAMDLDLTGSLETGEGRLEARGEARVHDAAVLDPVLPGARIEGLVLVAEAGGTLDAPDIDLRATATSFAGEGIEARDLVLEGQSRGVLDAPDIDLRATASSFAGEGIEARDLVLEGQSHGVLDAPDIDLRATASSLAAAGTEILELALAGESHGSLDAPEIDLRATASSLAGEGIEARDLALEGQSRGGLDAPDIDLRATAASFVAEGIEALELALEGQSRGPLAGPELSLDARVAALAGVGITAAQVSASALFEPESGSDITAPTGQFQASGQAARFALDDLADLRPAIGRRLDWSLEGRIDLGQGAVEAASLSLETDALRLTGGGALALESGAADGAFELAYPDLFRLAGLLGREIAGTASVTARVATDSSTAPLRATVSAAFDDLALGDAVVQALLGPTLEIESDVLAGRDGAVTLSGLTLESPAARVTGRLAAAPDFAHISSEYRVEIADLGVLGPALGRSLAGSAALNGRAEGSLSDLEATGNLAIRNGELAGRAVEAMSLDFTALNLPARPSGDLDARVRLPMGEVEVAAAYLIDGEVLTLDAISLAAEGSSAEGSARIPLAGAPLSLELTGQAASLAPWLALAGFEGDGGGMLRLSLSPRGGRQTVSLDADLRDLAIRLGDGERLALAGLKAGLESGDIFGAQPFDARLVARDLALADLTLATATVEASGEAGGDSANVTVSLVAEGQWRGDLRLDTAVEIALSDEGTELRIAHLEGRALDQDIALAGPARVAFGGSVFELQGLDATLGEARLRAAAELSGERLSADLTVEGLPLAALRPFLDLPLESGSADLTLRVGGTAARPDGQWTLDLRDARLADLADLPPLRLRLDGDWRDGRVKTAGRLSGLAEEDAVLDLELPLRLDPETLVPYLPPRAGVTGRLSWRGPVEPLWSLAPLAGHRLAGLGDMEIAIDGPIESPRLAGQVTLGQGSYESLEAGTLLTNLEITAAFDGTRVRLTSLTAGDGGAGSLSASGDLDIAAAKGFPAALEAGFTNFILLRRDEITAVSNGKLSLTANQDGAHLAGQLETDTIEIRIPDRLPPSVVDLGVVEAGATGASEPGETPDSTTGAAAGQAGAYQLALDVAIDIPQRAFIRGRGLDSEWAGRLEVSGTAEAPVINGGMNLVRGQITALGRTFKLDKGSVQFLGGETIDPVVDIAATADSGDYAVTVAVRGPVAGPSLEFSSNPELPEDEVVSRILFGKSTTQLSAAEAAQLAASVAQLSGRGGGLGNMLANVRAALGVDVLRLDSGGDEESGVPGVAAGKYLTEDIYVGAKQGVTPGSSAAEIEVELTPNIVVESEVGGAGQSEVGVKFKWDY